MLLNGKPLSFKQELKLVGIVIGVVTLVEFINLITQGWLNQFGLVPREVHQLLGIFFSPFLHGSVAHYLSNILPLAVFSLLLLQYGKKAYFITTLWLIVSSGILVWLFGRTAYHIGASGLIYGYFGFLILAGFMAKQLKLIVISVAVAFVYGGLVWGVFPNPQRFVSWEYHLFGFLAGLVAARYWQYKKT